ncbi:WD40 repeat domain-containing protein [Candidatus Dependentiae bacterium]|nr:WD40 repeat domain-containing protein [Candidatus Dependentiae bacterium]
MIFFTKKRLLLVVGMLMRTETTQSMEQPAQKIFMCTQDQKINEDITGAYEENPFFFYTTLACQKGTVKKEKKTKLDLILGSENYVSNLFFFWHVASCFPLEIKCFIAHLLARVVLGNTLNVIYRPVKFFFGHTGVVQSVAFNPLQKTLITASWDKTACIWDNETEHSLHCEPLFQLKGHTNQVRSVAYSSDGKNIVTGSLDGTVCVWNIMTRDTEKIFTGHTAGVNSVVFSPCGKFVFSGSDDKTARLWHITSGDEVVQFEPDAHKISSVAYSPDGKMVLAASCQEKGDCGEACTVWLWDTYWGKLRGVLTGHTGSIVSTAFSSDSKYVLTGSYDETARLWSLADGKEVLSLQVPRKKAEQSPFSRADSCSLINEVTCVAFSPDEQFLFTGEALGNVRIWDRRRGIILSILEHEQLITSIAISKDGASVLAGSVDGNAYLWGLLPYETRKWILDSLTPLTAGFILKAVEHKNTRKMLNISKNTLEGEVYSSMPYYVQDSLKKWLEIFV